MKRGRGRGTRVKGNIILVLLVAVATTMSHSAAVCSAERTWTRSEILEVTDKEAQRLSYFIDEMSVSFDADNSVWQRHMKAYARLSGMTAIETKLRQLNAQDYWAVYYGPLGEQRGGDLWVFVDRQTGDILGTIQGQ